MHAPPENQVMPAATSDPLVHTVSSRPACASCSCVASCAPCTSAAWRRVCSLPRSVASCVLFVAIWCLFVSIRAHLGGGFAGEAPEKVGGPDSFLVHEIIINKRLQHLFDALQGDAFFDRHLFDVLRCAQVMGVRHPSCCAYFEHKDVLCVVEDLQHLFTLLIQRQALFLALMTMRSAS